MADSTGRNTSTFDAVGQTMVTASPNNQRQTFSYDTIGLKRSIDATGAGRSTYVVDAANQISSLRNPYSERTTFGYDDAGRRNVQRNANGTRVSLSYDAASQTTQVFHRTSAGASVLQLDYQYDNAGNRKSMAENGSAARTTWTYDKQNQLLSEYRTGTNPYRQTFTYDAAGNRTLKNVDTVRTTYAYDVANQLKYGQAVAGRTTFAYDLTGNQRIEQPPTGNRTTTTWNYENQPAQYLLPTGSPVTMTYNGDNRRVISQQATTTTKFVWDSTTDAYLSELDGANAVQAVYTNEPQLYGSVVSQRRSSTSHWLHADALGTTRRLTSSTQTTTDSYLLDAWGNPITSSGTTVNPFRWVGRYGYYQDSSTGLVYVRARMYQPTVARWISLDPIRFAVSINLYLYALNSASMRVDPSGLICNNGPYCGPDVGAWFAMELCSLFTLLKSKNFSLPSSEYENFWKNLKYENSGLLNDPRCPTKPCENSVSLCSSCISVTELGNLAFGLGGAIAKIPAKLSALLPRDFDPASIVIWGGFWAQIYRENRGFDSKQDISAALGGIKLRRLLEKNGCPLSRDQLCKVLKERPTFESSDIEKVISGVARLDQLDEFRQLWSSLFGGGSGGVLDPWSQKMGIGWRIMIESASQVYEPSFDLLHDMRQEKYKTCRPCPYDMTQFLESVQHVSLSDTGEPKW